MYLDHYKLKLMPFEIGPDPRFLWLGSKHKEAYSALRYGILESKGFIVIIGDPGTGKSTLLSATAANFGSNVQFGKITDPAMNEMDFFNHAANAFEMGKIFTSKSDFLIEFEKFVKEAGAQSKKIILVIDEAQRLTTDMLEQIRIFLNVETPGQNIVSCIFAGQTEFLDMVKQNRALAQRVFFSHIIQPLTLSETGDYITHRLKIAGTEVPIFTSSAVQEIFQLTGGIPRLINTLCDLALLSGYTLDKKTIGPDLVKESTEDTLISVKTSNKPAAETQKQDSSKKSAANATEPVADNTTELPQNGLERTVPRALNRKIAYWASIAFVVVVGLAAYLYITDGFRAAPTGTHSELEQAKDIVLPAASIQGAGDIGRLQGQMLALKREKDEAEIRIKELQTQFGPLEQDKQELETTIADLQKKSESVGPAQDLLKAELDAFKQENSQLQAELVEIKNQKSSAEAKLGEIEKQNTGLVADSKELNSAREQAARLEAEVAERNKKMIQLEQKFGKLELALAAEEAAKKKLEGAESTQNLLKGEVDALKKEISQLQAQLVQIKNQKSVAEAKLGELEKQNTGLAANSKELKSARAQAPATSQSQSEPASTADTAPDPTGIIDFVFEKKSQ